MQSRIVEEDEWMAQLATSKLYGLPSRLARFETSQCEPLQSPRPPIIHVGPHIFNSGVSHVAKNSGAA